MAALVGGSEVVGRIYTGYDPNAPWRTPAEDRIEPIRKGDLRVEVRDLAGNAVPDAAVHVRMLRHAFIFGSEVEPPIILDQGDPAPRRYLNEIGALEDFGEIEDRQNFIEEAVKYLKRSGAPIGGVGLESHFLWPPTPPEDMLATLDRFGAPGVALEGTEFDVDVADETLQADFTRDHLTVMFSHPSVVGVLV